MIFDIYITISTDNQGILNAIKNVLPLRESSKVWPDEYNIVETENSISGEIKFYDIAERIGFLNSLKGLHGVISQCDAGSIIKTHECYHKWNKDNPDNKKECKNIVVELEKI
ncbi:hypothetical protein KAR91_76985 [Candidatus Pacearchaeota archaeon]|nr:hypothetical protein [Candidatus Pacearchaeota archaeon]